LHDAKEQVLAANEHAKSNWETLQTIRVDGGWLRTDERDVCDVRMAPFICKLPVSQIQPNADIENPFNKSRFAIGKICWRALCWNAPRLLLRFPMLYQVLQCHNNKQKRGQRAIISGLSQRKG